MLSYKAIESDTLELLKKIMKEECFRSVRLVGGTALALQYGHRKSVDLDFFGNIQMDVESMNAVLRKYGQIKILKNSPNINIYIINGIKVDFVNYSYPWIDDMVEYDGIRLASPVDIAAMKVNAIEGRGTKKDFVDIYFLLQHFTLERILEYYSIKYPEHSVFRAIMSLLYFDDAEMQMMPDMFLNVQWEDMKTFISECVAVYNGRK